MVTPLNLRFLIHAWDVRLNLTAHFMNWRTEVPRALNQVLCAEKLEKMATLSFKVTCE